MNYIAATERLNDYIAYFRANRRYDALTPWTVEIDWRGLIKEVVSPKQG